MDGKSSTFDFSLIEVTKVQLLYLLIENQTAPEIFFGISVTHLGSSYGRFMIMYVIVYERYLTTRLFVYIFGGRHYALVRKARILCKLVKKHIMKIFWQNKVTRYLFSCHGHRTYFFTFHSFCLHRITSGKRHTAVFMRTRTRLLGCCVMISGCMCVVS